MATIGAVKWASAILTLRSFVDPSAVCLVNRLGT
jgi:hypothetical protein